jgi:ubiquinone biosynthesis protein
MNEVAKILAKHGFGLLVSNIDIPGFPKTSTKAINSTPTRACAALQELGPTFIKLGQILSTRPDILPEEYISALQSLQDSTSPVAPEKINSVLSAELGVDWRNLFKSFDDTPLATASIAQVHRATLKDGSEVVLKIQRPKISRIIEADLSILEFLTNRLLNEYPEAEYFDPKGVIVEFNKAIHSEIDFTTEAKNIVQFSKNFEDDPNVIIPDVVSELSSSKVLCMTFLDGVSIRMARQSGADMEIVGRNYMQMAYKMIFEHSFFHGDLHPGNVLVLEGNKLGLLDFGMTGRLTREMRDNIVSLMFALERGDFRTVARVFYDIAIKETRVDYSKFEADSIELIQKNWSGSSIQEIQIGLFLTDLAQGAMKHKVKPPAGYTMLFKALITTEGLAKTLLPEIDPIHAARPYVTKLVADKYSPQRIREDLFYHAVTLSAFIRRLPTTASQLMDDLDNQRLKLNYNVIEDPSTKASLDRRNAALVTAILSIGGAMCGVATHTTETPLLFGHPMMPTVFFVVASVCGAISLYLALSHPKK